jgi:hypothetical protein
VFCGLTSETRTIGKNESAPWSLGTFYGFKATGD